MIIEELLVDMACDKIPHRILLGCTYLLHNMYDIDYNVELLAVHWIGVRDRTLGRNQEQ